MQTRNRRPPDGRKGLGCPGGFRIILRLENARYTHIRGEYIPTAKNSQVADLYLRLGCSPAGAEGQSTFFHWEAGKPFAAPGMIECAYLTGRVIVGKGGNS
jgi:hypothetical protein